MESEGSISPFSFYRQLPVRVTRVSFIYQVDKIFFLFLVSLSKLRTLRESKVLLFLFLVLIKGMSERER